MAAPSRRPGELVGIQYLRGIAAMLVVIFHLEPQLRRMGYGGPWLPGLSGGVDIFFVISGFIMWVTTCGQPIGPIDFWRRRIVRIVPLYWIMTTFMVGVMMVAPSALQSSVFELRHVVTSYLFWPSEHPFKHVMEPVIMPGWTLNCEMFFYLIFGLFLLAPVRLRLWGTVGVLVLLVAAGLTLRIGALSPIGFYTQTIILEFALGMILGAVAVRPGGLDRIPAAAGAGLLVVAFAALLFAPSFLVGDDRFLVRGFPAAGVVLAMLILERRGRIGEVRLLHRLGDASYSIYLTHFFTLSAFSQLWRRLHLDGLPGGKPLFCIAALVVAGLAGWLCFVMVERPLVRLFRKRGEKPLTIAADPEPQRQG